jgi:uncharacterized protein (UPF0371 family)
LKKIGFDNKKYLNAQAKAIRERVEKFGKLYFEIGGRLTFDGHASRVLPGYHPDNKLHLLKKLGKDLGMLYCVNSIELQKGTLWSDTSLTLDKLAEKETQILGQNGVCVIGIVATFFNGQKKVIEFKKRLEKKGKKLFTTSIIQGYPVDLKSVFGGKGFDSQELIPTDKKIVGVTGCGANSGKMFVCLSQIYNENRLGGDSGFAKFETFPIWNLPINHEVNVAYEAATADIHDGILIDPFHKEAYGVTSVNYNRDIENFAILKRIIQRIAPKDNFMHEYKSPTDMGLNMAKKGIINDSVVRAAAREEIVRRYYFYKNKLHGEKKTNALKRMEKILKKVGLEEIE